MEFLDEDLLNLFVIYGELKGRFFYYFFFIEEGFIYIENGIYVMYFNKIEIFLNLWFSAVLKLGLNIRGSR